MSIGFWYVPGGLTWSMSGRWLMPMPHRKRGPCSAVSAACWAAVSSRGVHPDVEDAGGDGRRRRRPEEVGERAEHVAADVGDPQRRVAERLQLGGERGRLAGVAVAQRAAPDAGAGRGVSSWRQPATWSLDWYGPRSVGDDRHHGATLADRRRRPGRAAGARVRARLVLEGGPLGPPGRALRQEHRVVRWDRRGIGRSGAAAAATGPDQHADDLAALLDHLGIDKVTVVGHAGGGPSTVAFAAHHPDRVTGMVLVDTGLNDASAPSAEKMAAYIEKSASKLDDDEFFERLYRSFFGPRAAKAVVDDAVANALATNRATAAAEMRHVCADTMAWAKEVRCPVLWVSANPDDTANPRGRSPT